MQSDPKTQVIARILDNPVYTPESGLYKRLAKVLGRLSLVDLSDLQTLLQCKTPDHKE